MPQRRVRPARRSGGPAHRAGGLNVYRPVVWVTGASRGIGREIARQFASIGCQVCVSARNRRELTSLVNEIVLLGGKAYAFPCDISQAASADATAKRIRRKLGSIDILINNAGITVFKNFLDTSPKEFASIIATNLLGHIMCIRAVLPSMVRKKQGWVFNILSNAAIKTFEGSAAYTATKAGMLGLGKVLREEMRKHNVRVVNVIPGATETAMWSPADRRRYRHRMMSAKSVAEAVLSAYQMPDDIVVDELVVRPMRGDID